MRIVNNSRTLLSSQINASKHNNTLSVNEIVSDEKKKIHQELYQRALSKMKEEYSSKFIGPTVFTEQLSEEGYDKPSHVIVSVYSINNSIENPAKIPPVLRYDIDLTPWWDEDIMLADINIGNKYKYKGYTDWTNCECIYKDYINSTARIKNKIDGWTREISLKMLSEINNSGNVYIPDSEQLSIVSDKNLFSLMWKSLHPEKYKK